MLRSAEVRVWLQTEEERRKKRQRWLEKAKNYSPLNRKFVLIKKGNNNNKIPKNLNTQNMYVEIWQRRQQQKTKYKKKEWMKKCWPNFRWPPVVVAVVVFGLVYFSNADRGRGGGSDSGAYFPTQLPHLMPSIPIPDSRPFPAACDHRGSSATAPFARFLLLALSIISLPPLSFTPTNSWNDV